MSGSAPLTFSSAVLAAAITAALAVVLTGWARRYATKKSLLDVPNDRSSHRVPTVRGGGISIVICALVGGALLWISGQLDAKVSAAWFGGLFVAWIGWRDDHGHVSPARRALIHFVAAAWAVAWIGGVESIAIGDVGVSLGWIGTLASIVGVAWLINLFNFMDGIDGFAGAEGLFVAGAGGLLLWLGGATGLAALSFILAASCAGFLVWNWPPAKIFMGDVGSGALGLFVAVCALAGDRSGAVPITVWIILSGVFVCDATFTLLRRVGKGEKWYTAHRSHAYQRLIQLGHSHASVTVGALTANILVLFPMALLGWSVRSISFWLTMLMLALGLAAWWLVQRKFDRQQVLSGS